MRGLSDLFLPGVFAVAFVIRVLYIENLFLPLLTHYLNRFLWKPKRLFGKGV